MGYDFKIIREQLEHRTAEQLAALLVEWEDDQVMTWLINEARALYHGLAPGTEFRPTAAQLEALGLPRACQFDPSQIGIFQATDRPEREATRMVIWWLGSDQYQLRRRAGPGEQWSIVHAAWSTEANFTGLFARYFSSPPYAPRQSAKR